MLKKRFGSSGTTSSDLGHSQANRSYTKSAIYAQERRNNEAEAREELKIRLPPPAQDLLTNMQARSDFSPTTKVCAAALLYLDRNAVLPLPAHPGGLNTKGAEYNALRRANESIVTNALKQIIPQNIQAEPFMQHGNLNQTSKTMVAVSRWLDSQAMEMGRDDPSSWAALSIRGPVRQDKSETRSGLTHQRQRTFASAWQAQDSTSRHPAYSIEDSSASATPRKRSYNEMDREALAPPNSLDLKPPPYKPGLHQYSRLTPLSTAETSVPTFIPESYHNGFTPINALKTARTPLAQGQQAMTVLSARDIEQVAQRFVAKAREVLAEQTIDLTWVHDLLVDACEVVGMSGMYEDRPIREKWEHRRQKWISESLLEDSDSDDAQ